MTVTTTTNRIDAVGDGVVTVYPYNFLVYVESHLQIYFDGVLQTTGFTINNDIDNSNGDVTFDTAPASGVAVALIRVVPLTQLIDYTAYDPFPAETHERGLDLGVMRDQQNAESDSRELRVPGTDPVPGLVPEVSTRATKLLGFDAAGDPIMSDSTVDDVDALVAAGLGSGSLMSSFSFIGDGVETSFLLGGITINHAASILAYIDGISQNPEVDYNVTVGGGGTTVTFTTAPPNLSDIRLHIVGHSKPVGDADASNITYIPHNGAPGVQGTAADNKLDQSVSAKDWGCTGDGVTDERVNMQAAYDYCVANGKDLYIPAGSYRFVSGRVTWGEPVAGASLLDLNNVTVHGDGRATLLWTDVADGADVVNVNNAKNITFRDFAITALVTGAVAGSNGVSITNGFDNLNFFDIYVYDLGYLDKGTHLDGGKAFTIQSGTAATERGTINCRMQARGCVEGAGMDINLDTWAASTHAIDVHMTVEDCYQGFKFSGAEATGALSPGMTMGIRWRGFAVNCQRSVVLARVHGIDVDVSVVTTKSITDKRLNVQGGAWNANDDVVDALLCQYGKNSIVRVNGDPGGVDWKVQVGGTTAGASGVDGHTDNCVFDLDLGGQSFTADFNLINASGAVAKNCVFRFGNNFTAVDLPALLYGPAYDNTIVRGNLHTKLDQLLVGNKLSWSHTDGQAEFWDLFINTTELTIQQRAASSANFNILKFWSNAGVEVFGVTNNGGLTITGIPVSAVDTPIRAIEAFDNSGVRIGWIPVYTNFTA